MSGRTPTAVQEPPGGSLGFLLPKSYLDPERPQRELRLLLRLQKKGVPVVTPLAALARKQGLFYRLRLLTELLPGAMPLPAFLARHPRLRGAAIEEAGRVVRLAFAAGLWHPDLHPDNLLAHIPEDAEDTAGKAPEVRLLDLDRAADTADIDEKLIASKISERSAARTAKDWTTSDRIRDELEEMGVAIKDGPDGTTWVRIVRDRGE